MADLQSVMQRVGSAASASDMHQLVEMADADNGSAACECVRARVCVRASLVGFSSPPLAWRGAALIDTDTSREFPRAPVPDPLACQMA